MLGRHRSMATRQALPVFLICSVAPAVSCGLGGLQSDQAHVVQREAALSQLRDLDPDGAMVCIAFAESGQTGRVSDESEGVTWLDPEPPLLVDFNGVSTQVTGASVCPSDPAHAAAFLLYVYWPQRVRDGAEVTVLRRGAWPWVGPTRVHLKQDGEGAWRAVGQRPL